MAVNYADHVLAIRLRDTTTERPVHTLRVVALISLPISPVLCSGPLGHHCQDENSGVWGMRGVLLPLTGPCSGAFDCITSMASAKPHD